MAIEQNFLTYQKSIGEALKIEQNRIRNLIGSSHWLTDGEYKESILRKVLKDFLPEIYRVGTGFVCYPNIEEAGDNSSQEEEPRNNSNQIDILITSKKFPTLYKSGELHFVTPECVNAIVEVKTKLTNGEQIKEVLQKLSNDVKKIRKNLLEGQECWAGLFVYEKGTLSEKTVLEVLQSVASEDINGVINCISIGENMFIRFWEKGHPASGLDSEPIWHSYNMKEENGTPINLAQPYFINNIVAFFSPVFTQIASDALFPIKDGGKEKYKNLYIKLNKAVVYRFNGGEV